MAPRLPMPRITLKRRPSSRNDSPGLSSVPASIEPIITLSAPAASALTTSPEYLTPPSAITGTSAAPCTPSRIAVIWGIPTPVTTRVVQIEPGPTPTLTASTPRSTSARAPSVVATLPPTSCASGGGGGGRCVWAGWVVVGVGGAGWCWYWGLDGWLSVDEVCVVLFY